MNMSGFPDGNPWMYAVSDRGRVRSLNKPHLFLVPDMSVAHTTGY